MSDAAEFFANKKKKKKTFKFNANKIDVAAVTSITHVDAPALSTDHEAIGGVSSGIASLTITELKSKEVNISEQWDDEALAATYIRKGTTVPSAVAGLLDIKALDPKRGDQDDIAEKLRVEETKARLAAAREGMEREAQRIKEEREKKEQGKKEKEAASSGKWVMPHNRHAGSAGGMGRSSFGSSFRRQELDVQDENLFPDLAAADAILEQQQKQQQQELAQKIPKKTPVGAGAAWASRRAVKAALENKEESGATSIEPSRDRASAKVTAPSQRDDCNLNEVVVEKQGDPEVLNEVAGGAGDVGETFSEKHSSKASEEVASREDGEGGSKVVRKKKKKKDLSTFEPAS